MRRVDDIAPTLMSPMLAGLVSSICLTGGPTVPKGPASPKTEEGLWGVGGAPAQPDVPGPSHIGGPVVTEGNKPLEQGGIDLDATIPAFTSGDAAAVVISDDDATSFPGGWPGAISTPKIELAWGHKRPSEDRSPRSSPLKRCATEEQEQSLPPEFRVGTDKEFLLCNFHPHQCLMRQSFNLKGRCRQLAFCPYCRVINENSDTALSHVRKHLDLQFACGACYSRSFLNGPALNKHMRTQCPSVSAIQDCSRSSRR